MSEPFVPNARDLFAAIVARDSVRVNRILDEGGLDPGVDLHPEVLTQVILPFGHVLFKSFGSGPVALHGAVVCFFDAVHSGSESNCALSLDIIRQLLEFGADSSVKIRNMSFSFQGTLHDCESKMTPIHLAVRLKKLVLRHDLVRSRLTWSNRLIELLRVVTADSTKTVLHHVDETYEKMLFSEKFSDIKIICGDEVIVHAHKIVLAESSKYFDAAFDGPWKETESGEWTTSHPSHVIKVVLTLLYTGKLDKMLCREGSLGFCQRRHGAAHLYNSSAIRNACAEYVKDNALAVLQHAEIMILKTENPDAWDELWKAIELMQQVDGN